MNAYLTRYRTEIDAFLHTCHHLAKQQYVTGHGGNLAWRLETDLILITPTKTAKGDVHENNLVFIDSTGNKIAGGAEPTGETPLYLTVFAERPDVRCVLHCHPPLLNAFAISDFDHFDGVNPLERPFFPETITEVGPIPLVPYAEPLTQELADVTRPFLHNYNGFLMQNHGLVLVTPKDITWARMCTDLLEMTAKHILHSVNLGGLTELSEQQVRQLDRVMQRRQLPMFGAPDRHHSLTSLYFPGIDNEASVQKAAMA